MLTLRLKRGIEVVLGDRVRSCIPLSGGCIAHAARLETTAGIWLLKRGEGLVANSLQAEADGLARLGQAGSSLRIPAVRAVGPQSSGDETYLILEWIESGEPRAADWSALGVGLAELHHTLGASFGYHRSNYIGRLPQLNHLVSSWPEFFRTQRLEPQIKWAREASRWNSEWNEPASRLQFELDNLLPHKPPASLLHGDLWAGNVMMPADGGAAVIDPAVYYGDRETDLAMTELFGGFGEQFYRAYQETWPLEPGYTKRKEVYNLYHLLNHLNHFGSGYAGAVAAIFNQFR